MARYKLVKELDLTLIGVVINDDTHPVLPIRTYIYVDTHDGNWDEYLSWAESNTVDEADILIDYMSVVISRQYMEIFASDWIEQPDAPLTAEEKILWQNYRKEIVDLMIARPVPINKNMYEAITWPTAP